MDTVENLNDTAPVPSNEEEADALLSSIDNPESTQQEPTPEEKQAIAEYEIKHGGKVIKAPIDKILRWAEQGYDAPTRIGELNKKIQSWTQKEQEFAKKEQQFKQWQDQYGPVDEYVKKNPQWWDFVTQQFQNMQSKQQYDPLAQQLTPLQQKLQELETWKSNIEQEREQQRMQAEDTAYQQEFTDLKKQYPQIDFSSVDEEGKSLEYKVLEHALKNGIKKFTTAFRDFYHDDLLKMKEVEAKENVFKQKNSNSKLGILGISSTPTPKKSDSVKGKTYDDLTKEALRELGISS